MAVQRTIHVRVSYDQVRAVLARVPRVASGSSGGGVAARALLVRVGLAALAKIKEAFLVRSRGGTDAAGLRWQPLSPKTVAYSRRHPGVPRRRSFWKYHPSFAVTARQRRRWWALYKRLLGRYGGDKARAAAHAWVILKQEGVNPTLMERYGGTKVEILRDTGILFNSLSPAIIVGQQAPPVPPPKPPKQVFRLRSGEVGVGTSRKWAGTHHKGVPGRIPRRPLWPDPGQWPSSWWSALLEQARYGVIDLILEMLRGA